MGPWLRPLILVVCLRIVAALIDRPEAHLSESILSALDELNVPKEPETRSKETPEQRLANADAKVASETVNAVASEPATVVVNKVASPTTSSFVTRSNSTFEGPSADAGLEFNTPPSNASGVEDWKLELFLTDEPWSQENALMFARYALLAFMLAVFYMFALRWDMSGREIHIPGHKKAREVLTPEVGKVLPWKADLEASGVTGVSSSSADGGIGEVKLRPPSPAEDMPLPIIWPKMMKLQTATQLLVPVSRLDSQAEWSTHVFGSKGAPVLTAAIRSDPGDEAGQSGRELEICTAGLGAMLLATVCCSTFNVSGLGGNSMGRFEAAGPGRLQFVNTGGHTTLEVSCRGLDSCSSVEEDEICGTVTSYPSGQTLAYIARRLASQAVPYHHFDIITSPGVDVVLTLACALVGLTLPSPPQAAGPHSLDVEDYSISESASDDCISA